MEQLRAICSCFSPRPNRRRKTFLILRVDNLLWGTQFSTFQWRQLRSAVVQRRLLYEVLFRKLFWRCEYSIRSGGILIHFPPESIHISPESLFTSLRNDYSHATKYT